MWGLKDVWKSFRAKRVRLPKSPNACSPRKIVDERNRRAKRGETNPVNAHKYPQGFIYAFN